MNQPLIPVEAELTLFRAQLNAIQKRRDRRYRCGLATAGKLQLPATGETLNAWVVNLSRSGVGLDMPSSLRVGLEFVLVLRNNENAIARFNCTVAHSTPTANGGWRVGAQFSEKLSADMLETLL